MSKAGAPKENKNAEKWTLEEAESFLLDAVELSHNDDYDFIGEIAKQQRTHKGTYTYLCNKYTELEKYHKMIKSNCEANCFRNGKKGDINTAMAIVNLKSNHGWTDRVDNTNNTKVTVKGIDPIEWTEDA